MSTLNQDQSDYWNGEVGQRWALYHEALDTAFAPFTAALFARAALAPGARVLDIGCGAGDTALRAARQIGGAATSPPPTCPSRCWPSAASGRHGRRRAPPRSIGFGPTPRITPSAPASITPSPASA